MRRAYFDIETTAVDNWSTLEGMDKIHCISVLSEDDNKCLSFSGETGVACTLEYNNNTGRLHEQNTYFESNSDGNMVDPNLLPVEPASQSTPHGGKNGPF